MTIHARWPGRRAGAVLHDPLHSAVRLVLAAGIAGALAAAPAFAKKRITIEEQLTAACLYDARDATMRAAETRRYCGCVVGRFMAAHKQREITAAQLRRVMLIWRGERSWPATPVGFSEFDYHAKSRCERATRA